MTARLTQHRAFSLLEVLLVISLIGMLFSLTLPAIQQARAAGKRAACQNHIHQIALALHQYESQNGGLPPRSVASGHQWTFEASMSWMTSTLPYLEYEAVWQSARQAYETTDDLSSDPPHLSQREVIRPFVCPADDRLDRPRTDDGGVTASFTSYMGVRGNMPALSGRIRANGVLGGPPISLLDITDGTSQTLMVGERPPDDGMLAGWWYRLHRPPNYGPDIAMLIESIDYPDSGNCRATSGSDGPYFRFGPGRTANPCDRFHFWSLHQGGANFAFADASVRFLPYSAVGILHSLASRDGGEVVSVPD